MMSFNEDDLSIENTPDHKLLEQIDNLRNNRNLHGLSDAGALILNKLIAEAKKRGLDV